ncbi:MAG: UDP-2,3-diacylglucosamine diphosphatase [Bacteroidales bacterium]|nr:UDP-2,3-diacylglucosamine diphosphatase [Bacteroidales bacterium]
MKNTYFVSDVHLGLKVNDPADREKRFVGFLKNICNENTEAVYLLGDIWDFWYEYKYVVPKGYVRVFAAILELIEAGVKVYFFEGNHDVWSYHYFEELGMIKLKQPHIVKIGDAVFCIGHGDNLGKTKAGYKFMMWVWHNKVLQTLFSAIHPRLAFKLGYSWSKKNRLARQEDYIFIGKGEPIAQWADKFSKDYADAHEGQIIDFFVFGHYHCDILLRLDGESELYILKDWIEKSPYAVFDGTNLYKEYL